MSFDPWVDAYDAARPSYPDAVYDRLEAAIGPLAGARVLEGGAGTGLATAGLTARGAAVVAFDVGEHMLRRAGRRAPDATLVVADGDRLPFRDSCVELICFAQSWHWLDLGGPAQREAARVLRAGGSWAGWWSHPRADGAAWFDAYQDLLEASCPGYERGQRDTDWGATLSAGGWFHAPEGIEVGWTRRVDVGTWLLDEQSKSYVGALSEDRRRRLLGRVEALLRAGFPTGEMTVAYSTWLWTARRRD